MPERGFGFIRGNDGRNYFVHKKSVAGGELVDGQQVEFDGMPGPKGYKAVSVIPGDLPLEPDRPTTLNATAAPAAEAIKLIPPGALEHLLKLAFSWSLTLLKILGVIILLNPDCQSSLPHDP
ncbi:cold-shock protein [Pseudomonas sp. MDT1-16]